MTSVLSFSNISSSEFAAQDKGTTSILTNAKPTFIIQPPSSINDSDLLSKRVKNSYLGDLLLKKVKSVTANSSEVNSINQSPTKGLKEVVFDTSDNQSIQEESTTSNLDTVEKLNLLLPQRSLSTPVFSNLHLNKNTNQSSQKQTLNALELLQKRLVEYQVMSLRDAIIKAHLTQGPLMIPTLSFGEEKNNDSVSPVKKIISSLQNDDDELEVYYGEVEYPLLHLAPKGMQVEEINKKAKAGSNKVKGTKNKKAAKLSSCSSPSVEGDDSLLESLTATRAGTQRSEPDMTVNLRELSEQVAELIGQTNKKSKETGKKNQKKQEKEKKQRGKKQEEPLSPVLKSKRMTERKKNRWQAQEEEGLKI